MTDISLPRFPPPLADRDVLPVREFAARMRQNVLEAFSERAFTEDVLSRHLFGREQLTFNRAAAIRHVLIDNADNYARTSATIRLLYPIAGRGLLLAEGEDWRQQRRTVAPSFAPRTVPLIARPIAAVADELAATLAAETGEVDLAEHMQRLAIEVAGRAMFSLEMQDFAPRMRAMLHDYGERLAQPTPLEILLPLWIPTRGDIARRRFRRQWLALIGDIIDARQAKGAAGAGRDLLDLMASDPETGKAVSRKKLADQVATMIAAGHATTAVALFWAFYLLAAAPAVQQRIAEEAAPLDLSPDGAADALPHLTYTRAVVQEALRLYPPAYGIFRVARRADEADGVPIPKGAIIMIAPWLLHRHRKLWTDPDVFDPARFLPGTPPPDRFAYLPFGIGPRVCIGAQFALTEATLVLARLVRQFEIRRADNRPVIPVAAITVRPDHPPPFRLRPR
ncbi:MAG: cytochrome P450 [Alphaproteobacteria bacterium]|nr:cytochrome P450 [Alphaproteobacteria bacterium]